MLCFVKKKILYIDIYITGAHINWGGKLMKIFAVWPFHFFFFAPNVLLERQLLSRRGKCSSLSPYRLPWHICIIYIIVYIYIYNFVWVLQILVQSQDTTIKCRALFKPRDSNSWLICFTYFLTSTIKYL